MENSVATLKSMDIIDSVNLNTLGEQIKKINEFQKLVHSNMLPAQDYGIVPGTSKPTLLKPGAEKLCMLMGLRSEFEIIDSTRDFEKGFFQYQVRCKLLRGDVIITEGLGSCNTKESKYKKQDAFSVENTVMKMAKKRSLIDAALMVGSLSNIFTQDIEDVDMEIQTKEVKREYTDQDGTISKAQAKRLFAIAKGDIEMIKSIMAKYGYDNSENIKKTDYEKICNEVEKLSEQK